jgi:hypothetical protein
MVEGPLDKLGEIFATTRSVMMQAAAEVIGKPIPVDCKVIREGERFYDEDGEEDFNLLMGMLEAIERGREAA